MPAYQDVSAFLAEMQGHGLPFSGQIVADGRVHRFRHPDDRGNRNCWYILHDTGTHLFGGFGCWKRDISVTWSSKDTRTFSDAEREQFRREQQAIRARIDQEQARTRQDAANKAARLWAQACPDVDPQHPYLARKGGLPPLGLRQLGDALVLPVLGPDAALRGLQFIDPTGGKRFLTGTHKQGGHFLIRPRNQRETAPAVVLLAEGWATACSLHLATGHPACIAFDAGNLPPVAQALRNQYPAACLVICADDDPKGTHYARQAATLTGGKIALPQWSRTDET